MGDNTKALADAAASLHEKKDIGSPQIFQRVVRESGGSWPMLDRTNYASWSLLMQVMLGARQLWVAITDGTPERETDRTAMECLLRSVPPEMVSTLAVKATMKEAWEAAKTMRLGMTWMPEVIAVRFDTFFMTFIDGFLPDLIIF
uniref:Uncharacterized protein n=1 Tax=Avena sativa TaxID=4498 RepID=A0ACD5UNL0_AVESA